MLYLGRFYFDREDASGEESCGHFTCLAKADNIDMAVAKFREHINELRQLKDLFSGAVTIYLDDVIEIDQLPEKAMAIDYISSSENDAYTMACSIPSGDIDGCKVYDWCPEDTEDDDFEPDPFVEFECDPQDKLGCRRKRHLRVIK